MYNRNTIIVDFNSYVIIHYFYFSEEFSASYDRINLQVSTKENVAYSRMDSELEDNPLYGGEGVGVVAIQGDGAAISAISPHHEYDRTFQPPQTPANGELS